MSKELERYYKLIEERPDQFVNNGPLKIETNPVLIHDFEMKSGRKIGVMYESPYRLMVVDMVYTEPGKYFAYERLMPANPRGAVVMIPIIGDRYLFLKQYRHAMRDYQYAFPRGFAEPGISPEDNARKELGEEIGGRILEVNLVGKVIADSGLNGDMVSVYECRIADYQEKVGYEEIAGSIELSKQDLEQWIREGRITDGFSLAALRLAQKG